MRKEAIEKVKSILDRKVFGEHGVEAQHVSVGSKSYDKFGRPTGGTTSTVIVVPFNSEAHIRAYLDAGGVDAQGSKVLVRGSVSITEGDSLSFQDKDYEVVKVDTHSLYGEIVGKTVGLT